MSENPDLGTSTTLLQRIRQDPTDERAWSDFVERYGRLIYGWCRKWGLSDVDSEDVTQNVLLDLARQMRSFVYDPSGSFRAWLRTVAHRSWTRFARERQQDRATLDGPDAGRLAIYTDEAGDDFLLRLEAENRRELLERAMEQVRRRVRPHTWQAFHLLAVEEHSGAEVARLLRMNVGTVFVARSKVQKMLRDEIRRLNEGESL
jgi:RNA polymerase sigma-70 factor (ECF subfamily)